MKRASQREQTVDNVARVGHYKEWSSSVWWGRPWSVSMTMCNEPPQDM